MEQKKIKVLHTEWSDAWGGQEIRIISEMLAIREQGVEVFLACRINSIIHKKALEKKIKVFTLPFKGNTDFLTIVKLIAIIKKNNINIVNTHSGKDTWVGGLSAKLARANFIRTRHLSQPINPSRLNFINELADFVFTTGESVRQDMIQFNRIKPNKILSIPTGVDPEVFNPALFDTEICRQQLNIANDEIAIGIIAVLRDSKRHDIFLDIALNLKNKYPKKKFKFFIVGEGPMRGSIESYIKKLGLNSDVVMLGHIENIPKILKALNIFLFTADRREGVPQSVMQALLMNTPTVSSNDGSTNDLHHENNFLISEPSFKELYINVEKMLISIENQDSLSETREYIMDNFGKDAATNKILRVYNGLINEPSNKK